MRPVSDKCRSGSPLPAAAFPAESKDGPPFAHFQRRLHLVLPEVVLEPQEVFHRVLVIGVVGDPFATLGGGIYRIQTNRDLTLEMPPDGLFRQLKRCPCIFLGRAEIIVPPALGMRPQGLHRVRPPVNKEFEVIVNHFRRRLE